MMNEELKAYVNAYMDGLEVEYRFNVKWYSVDSFSDFDGTSADYRIKPKGKIKMWQWVVKASDDRVELTGFHTKESIYENFSKCYVIQKAEWTEITVEKGNKDD